MAILSRPQYVHSAAIIACFHLEFKDTLILDNTLDDIVCNLSVSFRGRGRESRSYYKINSIISGANQYEFDLHSYL